MKQTELRLDDIKPYVRYAKILHMSADYNSVGMRAYDNRLIYFFSGEATLTIDGTPYHAAHGAMFLWTPDSVYSLTSSHPTGFTMIVVNFDYTFGGRGVSLCIPPVVQELYRPEKRVENVCFTDMPAFNAPVYISDMHTSEYDFYSLDAEFVSPQRNYAAMLSAIMQKLLLNVARQLISYNGSGTSTLVGSLIAYIHDNYSNDLSNAALGQKFSYHPNYLNRCMLASTGQSLHQYVINARVLKALELLQTTDMSVTDISVAVGFKSIKHFSQSFKKAYGYSPTHFR